MNAIAKKLPNFIGGSADLAPSTMTNLKGFGDFEAGNYTGRNLAVAFNNRGIAYKKRGELDRAIADYTQAIGSDPKDADAYYNRGIAYKEKGELDRSIARGHTITVSSMSP